VHYVRPPSFLSPFLPSPFSLLLYPPLS
jgi:hypothetical protein